MYFVVPLYLQIVSSLAAKQGDFGILRACISHNKSLRVECLYAKCTGSPQFYCKLSSDDPPISTDKCNHTIPNHGKLYSNSTTNYNCTLTRRGRVENVNLTVDYRVKKGKDRIKLCVDGACTMRNPIPASLWPLVIMMWTTLQDN